VSETAFLRRDGTLMAAKGKDDEQYFGHTMVDVCERSLDKDKDGWYHPNPKYLPYPSRHVSIRGVEEETYCAIDVTKMGQSGGLARILEEVETRRALFELYEGAIVSIAPPR
jgi:DEAD/DEAH box helicase domain-containing protein